MKKTMILLIKIILGVLLLLVVYLVGVIVYAQLTDYKPKPEEQAEVLLPSNKLPDLEKDTLVFYDWNIGYCGLGKESGFFFDSKSAVTNYLYASSDLVWPSKENNKKNYEGFLNTFAKWKEDADFITVQEIDKHSGRSYYTNQVEGATLTLGNFASSFGKNYDVKLVPFPFFNPMGKVLGGVGTFYKYQTAENPVKFAFPSNFSWPKGLFFLDRCFVKHRFNLKNGKQLVVINTHNSAFDGGKLKKQEMAYFKKYIVEEYAKGNYVVVGGDWNQIPPAYEAKDKNSGYEEMPVPADFADKDWKFAFDASTPTNRKVDVAYVPNQTYTTVIDFYLLSPNIELIEVKGQANGFEYSDHQPVRMVCKLKE